MNVTLSPELESFVDGRVATGAYNSRDAVVEAGLTLLQREELDRADALRNVRAKITSGVAQIRRGEVWDGEEVFRELLDESR